MELAAADSVVDIETEAAVALDPVACNYSSAEEAQEAAGDVVLPSAYQGICRVVAEAVGAAWAGLLGSLAHRNSDLQ
jgi:hypothetical protein